MGRVNEVAQNKDKMEARIPRQFVTALMPSACAGLARALRNAYPPSATSGAPFEDLLARLDKVPRTRQR
jgi:hypothetical protein